MTKDLHREELHGLPEKHYPADIAIELLVHKYPQFSKQGLFSSPIFLENFADRCRHILDNLPQDRELRRNIEMEFAYMAHDIKNTFDIDLYEHIERVRTSIGQTISGGTNERLLFQKFQQVPIQEEYLSDITLMVRYLNFLYEEAKKGLTQAKIYIKTCVEISQLAGGFTMVDTHVRHKLYGLDVGVITHLEDLNTYLGANDIDEYTHQVALHNNTSYVQATRIIGSEQVYFASLHAFIDSFHTSYIRPYVSQIPVVERYEIGSLLNDFRDILDPKQRIPDSFATEYSIEQMERNEILFRGRNIH